jgi:hypothetical protein
MDQLETYIEILKDRRDGLLRRGSAKVRSAAEENPMTTADTVANAALEIAKANVLHDVIRSLKEIENDDA